MICKKIRRICFLVIILLLSFSCKKVYAYNIDTNITGKTPYYDITSLSLNNNKITIRGWAYVNDKDNGKFNNNSIEFIPLYRINIVDKDGNIAKEGYYYKGDGKSLPTDAFSLTCILFMDNDGAGPANNGNDCMWHMNTNKDYNSRNEMLEKSINQSPYINKYYDGVDFRVEFDISDLNPDTEYHFELQMELNGTKSNKVNLMVYQDRIKPDESGIIETYNVSNYVKVTAEKAKIQYGDLRYNKASSYQDGCWFNNDIAYEYSIVRPELDVGNDNATYYYYGLKFPAWGGTSGSCNKITSTNNYKNGEFIGYAHAAWLMPYGQTALTIKRKDPCEHGIDGMTARDYAFANPGVCCDQFGETCCGNKVFIDKLYSQEPNHWLFGENYCCSPNNTYKINRSGFENYTPFSFRNYLPNTELESYKIPYWNKLDSTRFYSQSYIDNICNKSNWAGRSCPVGTTRNDTSTIYSMQYVFANETTNKINHEVIMELDAELKDVNKDSIGYDYFNDSDFETYIKDKRNNSAFNNINQKQYALKNTNFQITVNSVSYIGKKNNKYQYKVKFSINIQSLAGAIADKNNRYFLPVKLFYCEKEKSCNDKDYFEKNKTICCEANPSDNRCKCDINNEICYSWIENSTCSKEEAEWNIGEKRENLHDGWKKTSESIKFSNYPTLSEMKNTIIKAGTGFDYNIGSDGNIGVTHIIEVEARYNGNTECDNERCVTTTKENIKKLYNIQRDENDDVRSIKNLKYKFSGSTSIEDYEIKNISSFEEKIEDDTIIITKYEDGRENKTTVSYPSKIRYTYTYNLKLKRKYISKQDASVATSFNTDEKDYLDGGNRFYTSLTSNIGIYNIKIYLDGKGITGYLDSKKKFTCQYKVSDGIKTNKNNDVYFRQISLNNLFPNNRGVGQNWAKYYDSTNGYEYINFYGENDTTNSIGDKKNDMVYGNDPMYDITLTPRLITEIKSYNRKQENSGKGYLDWNTMSNSNFNELDSISSFLETGNSNKINWEENLKFPKYETANERRVKTGDFK